MKIKKLASTIIILLISFGFVTAMNEKYQTQGDDEIRATRESYSAGEFHNSEQIAYLNDDVSNIEMYANGYDSMDQPIGIKLGWTELKIKNYYFEIARNSKFRNSLIYELNENHIDLYNLFANSSYYWRTAKSKSRLNDSRIYTFKTGSAPRNMRIDGTLNVRDVGGWSVGAKRTKQGKLIRGGRLNTTGSTTFKNELTESGLIEFKKLKIKTIIDLRSEAEKGGANAETMQIYGIENYISVPMSHTTNNLMTENSNQIKTVFDILCNETIYPVYVNCNIGTDRTGMIAYLINSLLGVSDSDLKRDYLWSNFAAIGKTVTLNGLTGYENTINAQTGETWSEKTSNYLISIGISADQIASIKNILT